MKAKSCPSGKYWCFDDKKCKKIPLGYHIGARGYLYPDKDDDGNSDGNGNGKNGNGHGGNHSGNSGSNGSSGGGVSEGTTMQENFKRINQNGQTYAVMLQFRGRTYNIQMFIPRQTRPTRLEVQKEVNKIYPGAIVRYFEPRVWDPANPALVMPEQMQPGAKDLVQQSDYMKPALQQKKPKKKKHTCGEGVTLKKVNEIVDPMMQQGNQSNPRGRGDALSNILKKSKDEKTKLLGNLLTPPEPKYAKENLTYDIDPKKHKKERRDAKIGNLARKTTNPGEKSAAEKKSKGPKLFGEDTVRVEGQLGYVEFIDLIKPEPMKGIAERKLTKGEDDKKEDIVKGMKKSFGGFRKRYGDNAKSVMYATATKLAKEEVVDEGAAWTKKSGKNPEGGLNEKGRKSYERENPGSDLKAPQPEGGSRKKSFCARMGGMKKKLTSSKTANDPDSRINKALRKWKCNEEIIKERLGGKGYKPYTSMSGEKVSGDWEDSDRGGGHKWKERVGKPVKKKSPTYQAYVRNKIKEQLAPHIKKGVAAAKPLVKAQALQTGLPTKEKPKPPEKKDSKSIFSQLTNKDEID